MAVGGGGFSVGVDPVVVVGKSVRTGARPWGAVRERRGSSGSARGACGGCRARRSSVDAQVLWVVGRGSVGRVAAALLSVGCSRSRAPGPMHHLMIFGGGAGSPPVAGVSPGGVWVPPAAEQVGRFPKESGPRQRSAVGARCDAGTAGIGEPGR